MKNSIFNLGKTLNKAEQNKIMGGTEKRPKAKAIDLTGLMRPIDTNW